MDGAIADVATDDTVRDPQHQASREKGEGDICCGVLITTICAIVPSPKIFLASFCGLQLLLDGNLIARCLKYPESIAATFEKFHVVRVIMDCS